MRIFDQSVSAEELRRYQLHMLNRQLEYAASSSPFYNEHLKGLELPLESLDALSELPFMDAGDIAAKGFALSCLPQRDIRRIVTLKTSGTTGERKRIFFTAGDIERTVDFFSVGMRYMCGAGDSVAVFMPGATSDGIGDQLRRALERFGAQPHIYGAVSDVQDAISFLRRIKPHTIVGIPSQMRALALAATELRPVNVLLSADYVPLSVKDSIARLWHTDCFEHYGMTETCFGFAVDCPHHRGMHIRHDEFITEIVDENSAPLPPGQWGQIVITSLRRQAMPIIRYKTGDWGRLVTQPCPCGSKLPRLDHVRGRISALRSPVNIHALDEILLGVDGVQDYTARFESGRLTVYICAEADIHPYIKKLLGDEFPHVDISVESGEPFRTTGTLKRRLE
ncbi:MAG: phenylacetate--CoA ligase family protein [Oscillospiraceae bacterium]|nr:phenylacetate--CoA ligase family protein [Oscillospiraceae bacterium]